MDKHSVQTTCPLCERTTKHVISFKEAEEKDKVVLLKARCDGCGKKRVLRFTWNAWLDIKPRYYKP